MQWVTTLGTSADDCLSRGEGCLGQPLRMGLLKGLLTHAVVGH